MLSTTFFRSWSMSPSTSSSTTALRWAEALRAASSRRCCSISRSLVTRRTRVVTSLITWRKYHRQAGLTPAFHAPKLATTETFALQLSSNPTYVVAQEKSAFSRCGAATACAGERRRDPGRWPGGARGRDDALAARVCHRGAPSRWRDRHASRAGGAPERDA